MGTHNIRFYGEISKIIPELSPNTHLICSDLTQLSLQRGLALVGFVMLWLSSKFLWSDGARSGLCFMIFSAVQHQLNIVWL